MTEDVLRERLTALADTRDDGDWGEVRRRASRRRRHVVLAVALAVGVVAVAPAFGLHRDLIDFFHSEPAPARVQLDFNRMGVGAPAGMDPQIVPNSARKVMTATFEGKTHTLWVAPTRRDGFCTLWTDGGGGCVSRQLIARAGSRPDLRPGDIQPMALGASFQSSGDGIATVIFGNLLSHDIASLTLEYADGDRMGVPVTWVSKPIDAGFYVVDVPAEHQTRATHATALVGTDDDGRVVARQTFSLPSPLDVDTRQQLPNGEWTMVPAKAIAAKAQPLIDFRAANGNRITLWKIPTTTGVTCYVFNRGGGCPPEGFKPSSLPTLTGGIHGGERPVLWFGQARADVATVELDYQDGSVEFAKPTEGFVLREIPEAHYGLGHRLARVIARAANGDALEQQAVDASAGGVYPCEHPKPVGYGVTMCP